VVTRVNHKSNTVFFVRFEVLTTVTLKCAIFWDVTMYRTVEVNRRFGGTHCLLLRDRRANQESSNYRTVRGHIPEDMLRCFKEYHRNTEARRGKLRIGCRTRNLVYSNERNGIVFLTLCTKLRRCMGARR
jgi:hypothetical protein